MNIKQVLYFRNSRANLIGFLNQSDLNRLEELTGRSFNGLSFYECLDLLLQLKNDKLIGQKSFTECVDVVVNNNNHFRTERYRLETNSLYEISEDGKSYIFHSRCSQREYDQQYANQFID